MPSFAFLFGDQRGDDVVTYLSSLNSGDTQQHIALERQWQPSESASAGADLAEGENLYRQQCFTCHDANGRTLRQYQSQFNHPPNNLFTGPFVHLRAGASTRDRSIELSRISKFGIPGTDMPGHEYLSDRQIASLTLYLTQRSSIVVQNP